MEQLAATSNTIEFIPEGGLPSQSRKWSGLLLLNTIAIAGWYLLIHNKYPYGNGSAWLFLLLMLTPVDIGIMFFSKDAVKVTMFKDSGIFQYDYIDFWGNEKSADIYLKTAYFDYKLSSAKLGASMRLLIYNNYFKNQVTIRASDKIGFNRAQLDTIVENIKSIQDILNRARV
ncbi:MAG: hypothetical protein V4560_09955 [Bacteroidota bacterium]